MKIRINCKIAIFALFNAGTISVSHAIEIKKVSESVLRDENADALPKVSAIISAGDRTVVVAGTMRGQAWATKASESGKAIWKYSSNFPPNNASFPREAAIKGAEVTADGTIFLCGNREAQKGSSGGAFLVHLSKDGEVISEKIITSKEVTKSRSISHFDDCIRWNGGIVLVGHVVQIEPSVNLDAYYWVYAIDGDGKTYIDKLIPTLFDNIDDVRSLIAGPNNTIVFAGFRSGLGGADSELFRIDSKGTVVSKKRLEGQFQFIRQTSSNGPLEIHGYAEGLSSHVSVLLNDKMEEISRTQGPEPVGFIAKKIYRLSDGSLALFGQETLSSGRLSESRVSHVVAAFNESKTIALSGSPNHDGGQLAAVTPADGDGDFIVAESIFRGGTGLDARVGVAIEFLKF